MIEWIERMSSRMFAQNCKVNNMIENIHITWRMNYVCILTHTKCHLYTTCMDQIIYCQIDRNDCWRFYTKINNFFHLILLLLFSQFHFVPRKLFISGFVLFVKFSGIFFDLILIFFFILTSHCLVWVLSSAQNAFLYLFILCVHHAVTKNETKDMSLPRQNRSHTFPWLLFLMYKYKQTGPETN